MDQKKNCDACGAENELTAIFCMKCGAKLPESTPQKEVSADVPSIPEPVSSTENKETSRSSISSAAGTETEASLKPEPTNPGNSPVGIDHSQPIKPVKQTKKLFAILFVLIFILVLAGSTGIFVLYKYVINNPYNVLVSAFQKSADATSFKVDFTSQDNNIGLSAFADRKPNALSKIQVNLKNIEDKQENNLSTSIILNQKDLYFSVAFAGADQLIQQVKTLIPTIEDTQTYALVKPVLFNSKWVHLIFPESTTASDATNVTPTTMFSATEIQNIKSNLKDLLIIKNFENNYSYQGKSYKRIIMGLSKTKMLALLNDLKNSNADIKVAQVNSMIQVVNSVNNWDSDLIEMLINGDGYISYVTVSMPQIPKDALNQSISENMSSQGGLGETAKGLADTFLNTIDNKNKTGLIKVGTLAFSDYNSTVSVERPTDVVESEQIIQYAQKELLPLLLPLFMGGSYPSTFQNPSGYPGALNNNFAYPTPYPSVKVNSYPSVSTTNPNLFMNQGVPLH